MFLNVHVWLILFNVNTDILLKCIVLYQYCP
uniref:Uncharacterized protein n=1 Tax=Anguilla anguilla TaxID=7936 RepID=A0A0E9TK08_ANGAN